MYSIGTLYNPITYTLTHTYSHLLTHMHFRAHHNIRSDTHSVSLAFTHTRMEALADIPSHAYIWHAQAHAPKLTHVTHDPMHSLKRIHTHL